MTLTLDPPASEILDDLTRRRFVSGSLGERLTPQLEAAVAGEAPRKPVDTTGA